MVKAAWLTRRGFNIRHLRFGEESSGTFLVTPQRIGKHRDVLHAKGHEKEKTERLVKQRLPSVSTGRPQLLRTNIRHAVAAYGLMVTVQSELRRSAVRNAARKTARVISAALCAPPNDRPILLPSLALSILPPRNGTRNACGMPPECTEKEHAPQCSTLRYLPDIKTAGSWCFCGVIRLLNLREQIIW